ncbi:hypothetical protein BDZ90DRAFT_232861 [Jaminaea rosea]|uniref:Uncharacterized protein n=1 Tax=Jaminaea rosea TaxID=1569628 RepID=A0A316UNA1_9BASI|nr:hypothetical protein BDZ90DRAFT_232861 [Jaminaea rosea]PWN26746.1 hypothetical protein BDZ90DRAFT_232861 [Jaminaea rosea]
MVAKATRSRQPLASSSSSGQIKRVYGSSIGPSVKRFRSLGPSSFAINQGWNGASSVSPLSSPSPSASHSLAITANTEAQQLDMGTFDGAGPSKTSRSRSSSASSCLSLPSTASSLSMFDDDGHDKGGRTQEQEPTPPSSPFEGQQQFDDKKIAGVELEGEQAPPSSQPGTRFNGLLKQRPSGLSADADGIVEDSLASTSALVVPAKRQRRAPKRSPTMLSEQASRRASSSATTNSRSVSASTSAHPQCKAGSRASSASSATSSLSSVPSASASPSESRRLTPPPSPSTLHALVTASTSRPAPPADHPGRSIAHAQSGCGGADRQTGMLLRDGRLLVYEDDDNDAGSKKAEVAVSNRPVTRSRASRALPPQEPPQQQPSEKEEPLAKRLLKRKASSRSRGGDSRGSEAGSSKAVSSQSGSSKTSRRASSSAAAGSSSGHSSGACGSRMVVLRRRGRASAPALVGRQVDEEPSTSDEELSAFFCNRPPRPKLRAHAQGVAAGASKTGRPSIQAAIRGRASLPSFPSTAPYKLRTPVLLPERSYYARTKREEASPTPGALQRRAEIIEKRVLQGIESEPPLAGRGRKVGAIEELDEMDGRKEEGLRRDEPAAATSSTAGDAAGIKGKGKLTSSATVKRSVAMRRKTMG